MKKVESVEELTFLQKEEKTKKRLELIACGVLAAGLIGIGYLGSIAYKNDKVDKNVQDNNSIAVVEEDLTAIESESQSESLDNYSYAVPMGYYLGEDGFAHRISNQFESSEFIAVKSEKDLDYYRNNINYEVITTNPIAEKMYSAPSGFVLEGDKCVKTVALTTTSNYDEIVKEYPVEGGYTVTQDDKCITITCMPLEHISYGVPDGFLLMNTEKGLIGYKIIAKNTSLVLK